MRCLVTGAAGFIGSHLVDRLVSDGHEVLGLDNLSTGSLANVRSVDEFWIRDIAKDDIDPFFEDIDWVFHLAARADIVPSIQNPTEYHRSNVEGTLKVLEAARKHRCQRFVYAASSSCYGIPTRTPTVESSMISCEYPYALTKYIGEQYVLHWAKVYKLPAVSLRLFNVYGPRHRTSGSYGAVFGVFLSQLANGQPVTIVGDGEQKRDFTFVTDVCDAFVKAAQSEWSGMIYNIGTSNPVSVNQVAELLGAKEKVFIPKRPGEPDITHADILKAKQLLKFEPHVSIEAGCEVMRKMVSDFKTAPLWTPEKIKVATEDWFKYLGAQ